MKDLPLISVITVSYNQGEFIEQNIQSVLKQNYPNFEHLIIDAGSVDGTLDILKRYPHLVWTSEPDRGQSHGLNKGFARAKGEIILWLNSDDWYAENVFMDIVQQLKEYPVLLAAAQQTDREGNPGEIIKNSERTHCDLLRHWVPYNWLAQTSVFFTREMLEKVRLPDGSYLDESLHYAMDLDLWIRMAAHYPFTRRIDKVCSFFRIYETNKTTANLWTARSENTRVFQKYSQAECQAEHKVSLLLPVTKDDANLRKTIESVTMQFMPDFELILLDHSGDKAEHKLLKALVEQCCEKFQRISFRIERAPSKNLASALNFGVDCARSPLIAILEPGDILSPEFIFRSQLYLHQDLVAAMVSLKGTKVPTQQGDSLPTLDLPWILGGPYIYPNIVIKRFMLKECGGFDESGPLPYALQKILLQLFWNSCAITVSDNLISREAQIPSFNASQYDVLRPYLIADLFREFGTRFSKDPVSSNYRAFGGRRPDLTTEIIQNAELYLAQLPSDWKELTLNTPSDRIEQIVQISPQFAAAWYLRSKLTNDSTISEQSRARYNQLVQAETQLVFRNLAPSVAL